MYESVTVTRGTQARHLDRVLLEPITIDVPVSPGVTRGIGGFRLYCREPLDIARTDLVTARGVVCEVVADPAVWPQGTVAELHRVEIWDATCTIVRPGTATTTDDLEVSFDTTEIYDGSCRLTFKAATEAEVAQTEKQSTRWTLFVPEHVDVQVGDAATVTARAVGEISMSVVLIGRDDSRDELALECES